MNVQARLSALLRTTAPLSILLGMLLVAALATAAPALAQEGGGGAAGPEDFGGAGFYVQAGGATSFATDSFSNAINAALLTVLGVPGGLETANGVNGRVGVRSNPYLSSELQVEYQPGFKVTVLGQSTPVEAQAIAFTSNLKITPLTGRLQPYGIFGAGGFFLSAKVGGSSVASSNSWLIRGGGGIDFYVVPQFGVSVEATYVYPTGANTGAEYVSLNWGVIGRF